MNSSPLSRGMQGGISLISSCAIVADMTTKQRAIRMSDELWHQLQSQAAERNLSVNAYILSVLSPATAGQAAGGEKKADRFARLVSEIGPTAGYPYHEHEANLKATLEREQWVKAYRLPFHEADIIAACYAAGYGDPWAGFIAARVREQLNDAMDDVGSRPAVLRARLRGIARLNV